MVCAFIQCFDFLLIQYSINSDENKNHSNHWKFLYIYMHTQKEMHKNVVSIFPGYNLVLFILIFSRHYISIYSKDSLCFDWSEING